MSGLDLQNVSNPHTSIVESNNEQAIGKTPDEIKAFLDENCVAN